MTADDASGLVSYGYGVIVWGGWLIAVSLILFICRLVFRATIKGDWMPRQTVDRLMTEKDELIAYHKAATDTLREANRVQSDQIGALVRGGETTLKLIETAEQEAAARLRTTRRVIERAEAQNAE